MDSITLLSREKINIRTSTYPNALIIYLFIELFCFVFPRKRGHGMLAGDGHADFVIESPPYRDSGVLSFVVGKAIE